MSKRNISLTDLIIATLIAKTDFLELDHTPTPLVTIQEKSVNKAQSHDIDVIMMMDEDGDKTFFVTKSFDDAPSAIAQLLDNQINFQTIHTCKHVVDDMKQKIKMAK